MNIAEQAIKDSWPPSLLLNLNIPPCDKSKIKELSLNSFHSSLESQLEMEARFFTESLKSKDFEIGVDSFTKKEKPDFKGH